MKTGNLEGKLEKFTGYIMENVGFQVISHLYMGYLGRI